MSIEEVSPERFAQLLHHYHEALADETKNAIPARTRDAWADVPPSEKKRLVAAARLALLELEVVPSERHSGEHQAVERARRRYFAKPGEAEWGC
jgi:hypothetical protein